MFRQAAQPLSVCGLPAHVHCMWEQTARCRKWQDRGFRCGHLLLPAMHVAKRPANISRPVPTNSRRPAATVKVSKRPAASGVAFKRPAAQGAAFKRPAALVAVNTRPAMSTAALEPPYLPQASSFVPGARAGRQRMPTTCRATQRLPQPSTPTLPPPDSRRPHDRRHPLTVATSAAAVGATQPMRHTWGAVWCDTPQLRGRVHAGRGVA